MVDSSKAINDSLATLKGKILSSVEFLREYLQLRFDGPVLTAYTPPVVVERLRSLGWDEPGYRDALCDLVGCRVSQTSIVENDQLIITFDTGARIKIPLKDEDYRSIEAVYFVNEDGSFWVV